MSGPSHKLRSLERRLEYLTDRLATGDHTEAAGSHIRSEAAALCWALPLLVNHASISDAHAAHIDSLVLVAVAVVSGERHAADPTRPVAS